MHAIQRFMVIGMVAGLPVLMFTTSGCGGGSAGMEAITIKGSDTMVHLVSEWAEAVMEQNPEMEISVTGGGSGTGIAALINGTTDLCAASRSIEPNEIQLAEQRGKTPQQFVVALDGIAVIVHPSNPVAEASIEQVGQIFTGTINNWKDVGGKDQPILAYSRESSSGTYVFFKETVLKMQDYRQDARLMPATSGIIQAVTADETSIGYVGLGYALNAGAQIRILSMKADAGSVAVTPSDATVKTGAYPIARPLLLYSSGAPSAPVQRFIDFCLSPEGQKIVTEAGYVMAP